MEEKKDVNLESVEKENGETVATESRTKNENSVKNEKKVRIGRVNIQTGNVDILNVRSTPAKTNNILTTIKNGTKVQITNKHGRWYAVQLEDGTVGYCMSEFISEV